MVRSDKRPRVMMLGLRGVPNVQGAWKNTSKSSPGSM